MIPAIVSRCQTFEVKPISKPDVAKKLVYILKTEKVSFTMEDIKFIVETYYPDIRKVINFAQQSNLNGTIKIYKNNAIDVDFQNKLIDILKNSGDSATSLNEIRQLLSDHIDVGSLEETYRFLMDKIDLYAKGKETVVILRLAEGLKDSSTLVPKVRDIPFLACIYNILNDIKE
jgi:DNA polymerase III delta prime subunit